MLRSTPIDGNTAAAYVGYAFSETAFGYPITPSSPAYELVEEWASVHKRKNALGEIPSVVMMQHEGGVAGAVHGASVGGALTTTYTSSQGLLLMLPNILKVKFAQVPTVFHVASRALITQCGTIECDHSDVMTVRAAGLPMLSAASNQDVHDNGAVAHRSAMTSMIPFISFYDGFRTSHQITNVELLPYEKLATLIPKEEIEEFRQRAFNPNHPSLRMAAIDSSFHFQFETAASHNHRNLPCHIEDAMKRVSKLTGRKINLFDYHGHPHADSVIVIMGSTYQNVQEAVDYLNSQGQRVGVISVRCFRPFSGKHLLDAIPKSAKVITVLDRVNENGAAAQPIHADVLATFSTACDNRRIIGGKYGIGGRELTPSQASEVFKNSTSKSPRNHFNVGFDDDLDHTTLPIPKEVDMVPTGTRQCIFWGLGSDGTVGSNKEAIKLICDNTELYGQAFFMYDAKKSGGTTRSHLRFGPKPITSNYAVKNADYVAVHATRFPNMYPVAPELKEGGTFVLNCPATNAKELDKYLPAHTRRILADKKGKIYIIDASKIASECGITGRINLIMQAVFFKLSGVLPVDQAIDLLKKSVSKSYGHQGKQVVDSNINAINSALSGIKKIEIPKHWKTLSSKPKSRFDVYTNASKSMKEKIFPIFEMRGNEMKPSNFQDMYGILGTELMGSSKYEKRGIAVKLPVWDKTKCVQCNTCSYSCAHAAIRPYILKKNDCVQTIPSNKFKGYEYRISVSPYDCLGCGVCVQKCPTKALDFKPATDELMESMEKENNAIIQQPDIDALSSQDPAVAKKLNDGKFTPDGSQYMKPLLEFSGACGGCHETLYAKMLTQLFGPRLMIANATGCSIVWSGSFPSIPWTKNSRGQGPSWGNSLFEDNAEYGLGIYTAFTHRRHELYQKIQTLLKSGKSLDPAFKQMLSDWVDNFSNGEAVYPISNLIQDYLKCKDVEGLQKYSDLFVKPSVWIVGGDGWSNDIGFAGLDHVLAIGADVNALVYDNESYANTGFQMSKATPRSAVMKFAATGRDKPKKDISMMFMQYPDTYVASCCIGADAKQTITAMKEADKHPGSAFLDCYCPCIGQGIKPSLENGHKQAKLAVETGYWPLFRRNPTAEKPFSIDSKVPNFEKLSDLLSHEVRFDSLGRIDQDRKKSLQSGLRNDLENRWKKLETMKQQQ